MSLHLDQPTRRPCSCYIQACHANMLCPTALHWATSLMKLRRGMSTHLGIWTRHLADPVSHAGVYAPLPLYSDATGQVQHALRMVPALVYGCFALDRRGGRTFPLPDTSSEASAPQQVLSTCCWLHATWC